MISCHHAYVRTILLPTCQPAIFHQNDALILSPYTLPQAHFHASLSRCSTGHYSSFSTSADAITLRYWYQVLKRRSLRLAYYNILSCKKVETAMLPQARHHHLRSLDTLSFWCDGPRHKPIAAMRDDMPRDDYFHFSAGLAASTAFTIVSALAFGHAADAFRRPLAGCTGSRSACRQGHFLARERAIYNVHGVPCQPWAFWHYDISYGTGKDSHWCWVIAFHTCYNTGHFGVRWQRDDDIFIFHFIFSAPYII